MKTSRGQSISGRISFSRTGTTFIPPVRLRSYRSPSIVTSATMFSGKSAARSRLISSTTFAWGSRQDVVWGGGYTYSQSDTQGNLTFSLNPADQNLQLFSTFFQDEIALLPDKLFLTLGTKLEHNIYSGFSLMPNVRVSWTPSTRHMFWAAVSEAERTPNESDTSGPG